MTSLPIKCKIKDNRGMNRLQLIKSLEEERTKENELKIIELIAEDLSHNSTTCLNYFLQKFCHVKSNPEEFYYYFWITYSEKAYEKADKPIKYIALIMWQKYKKDHREENTTEISEKLIEYLLIEDFEDKLLDKICLQQLLVDLSPEEKQIIEDILNGKSPQVPTSLKTKLKNKLAK